MLLASIEPNSFALILTKIKQYSYFFYALEELAEAVEVTEEEAGPPTKKTKKGNHLEVFFTNISGLRPWYNFVNSGELTRANFPALATQA